MSIQVLDSPYDSRDYTVAKAGIKDELYPHTYYTWQPPIENQGATGNCVAQSLANIMECIDHKDKQEHKDRSVGYIYGSSESGTPGMWPRQACRALLKDGDIYRETWEYLGENPKCHELREALPGEIKATAKKIGMYVRINSEEELKRFMYTYKLPVLITGRTSKLVPGVESTGSHAVVAYGWEGERILYQNSWGVNNYYQPTGKGSVVWDNVLEAWGIVPYQEQTVLQKIKNKLFYFFDLLINGKE